VFAPRKLDPAEEDRIVSVRLTRQDLLDNAAHRFTLIIAEGRWVGGRYP